MHVVLLSTDLMMVVTAEGASDRHGVEMKTASNSQQAVELSDAASAIAIDLRTPDLDVEALVPRLREVARPHAAIVACGPHVHTESLAAATSAGCDAVITRGQFERRFDALLAELTARAAKERP